MPRAHSAKYTNVSLLYLREKLKVVFTAYIRRPCLAQSLLIALHQFLVFFAKLLLPVIFD